MNNKVCITTFVFVLDPVKLNILGHIFFIFVLHLLSYTNEKILSAPRIFDIRAARNADKANSKIFPFNFASFFSLQLVSCFTHHSSPPPYPVYSGR